MGEKQYFAEESVCASRVVGGVTLNHLVWARTLGAPTGLMALQGADEVGLVDWRSNFVIESIESLGLNDGRLDLMVIDWVDPPITPPLIKLSVHRLTHRSIHLLPPPTYQTKPNHRKGR